MEKDLQLIKLYCTVCQHYDSIISKEVQQLSNNFCPKFTDEESITIYLWGIANQKYDMKAAYNYIKEHYEGWFPELPSYRNFNRRICNLNEMLKSIAEKMLYESEIDYSELTYLLDSMPIVVAGSRRSGTAKRRVKYAPKVIVHPKRWVLWGQAPFVEPKATSHSAPVIYGLAHSS